MTPQDILAGPCLREITDLGGQPLLIVEPLRWIAPTAILLGSPVNFAKCGHGRYPRHHPVQQRTHQVTDRDCLTHRSGQ